MQLKHLYEQGVMPIHAGASALCLGVLAFGWVFGLGPLMSDSHQATSVLEQAEQAEFEAKQVKDKLDTLTAELALVQEKLDEQPVSLQPVSQINPLLADLAKWSEQHRLSITRTNASRRVALTYYDYVPVEIAGEGSYSDLMRFFEKLYKERGDLGIIRFSVNRQSAVGGVSFEMDLAWYVLSDDAEESLDPPGRATASVPTE